MSSRAQRRRAARDTATCAVALVLTMLGAACGLFAQLSHNTGAAMGYALLAGLAFVAALILLMEAMR